MLLFELIFVRFSEAISLVFDGTIPVISIMDQHTPNCIIPVLSSNDIIRDLAWYKKYVGFDQMFGNLEYAGMVREGMKVHLQYHLGTTEDPVLGSVIKIFVADIEIVFKEMIERDTISQGKLQRNTAWKTHEFGFYDLNKNGVYFVQDV